MQVADVGKRSRVSSEASSGAALQPQTMLDPESQLGLHLCKVQPVILHICIIPSPVWSVTWLFISGKDASN